MNSKPLALTVFLAVCVFSIGYGVVACRALPENVASHFGASGQPDGWTTRENFQRFHLLGVLLCTVLFATAGLALRKLPVSLINLRNKEYWFAPERAEQSYAALELYVLWYGAATVLLLLDMFHQAVAVNTGKAAGLTHPWLSTGVYLVFTVGWCVLFYRRFPRRPPEAAEQE